MDSKVYINGELYDSSFVNPKLHRFIGMFRPPVAPWQDPTISYPEIFVCTCGMDLKFRSNIKDHWIYGHMDIPQYVTYSINGL